MIDELTKLKRTNDENFQRSAPAPVGIVAAVSMNTSWKRNRVATPGVSRSGLRKNPRSPKSPKLLPPISSTSSWLSVGSPPNVERGPTPPICSAKPIAQNPRMPMAYTRKFIAIVWATFFARVRPVSTRAKPACMNITRKPATSVQTKLMATVLASMSPSGVRGVSRFVHDMHDFGPILHFTTHCICAHVRQFVHYLHEY